MANICSVGLHLEFQYKKDKEAFKKAFQKKTDSAQKRNEGVRISQSKWLFDAYINDEGEKDLFVNGSTRWCLEQEAMAEWTKDLKKWKVKSFNCNYEECGNQVFGEYSYEDGELWHKYLDDCHNVWNQSNTGEDDYFEVMDHALETDGVLEQIA